MAPQFRKRLFLALVAGTCVSAFALADDHPAPAKDDHAPAAEKHDAAAEAAKPKRRPARLKTKPADEPAAHATATEQASPDTSGHDHTDKPASDKPAPDKAAPAPATPAHHAATPAHPAGSIAAADALNMLIEGNRRWVANASQNPSCDSEQRAEQAAGQTPFVSILTCADSRIPVERVFDRGVGEIFTIRVAGNVAGDSETGTIEYGLGHLHTKLLVVMGHTKCGAVKACVDGAQNGALHGKVRELVASIEPAVERAKRNNPDAQPAQIVDLAVRENVWQGVYNLMTASEEIRSLVSQGEVQVVGALYDVQTGQVEFLGEHPWQKELLTALNAIDRKSSAPAATAPATAEAVEPAAAHGH